MKEREREREIKRKRKREPISTAAGSQGIKVV
jgi:hypothetical protein